MKHDTSKSTSSGEESDDCLVLIDQSVFSQRSYLEWKENSTRQPKFTGPSKAGTDYNPKLNESRRLSNNSEDLLSTCSTQGFDSRKNSHEGSFQEELSYELVYGDVDKPLEGLFCAYELGNGQWRTTSFCLCNLDTCKSLSRNIKISNIPWDFLALKSFLTNFGDVQNFDDCKFASEGILRVSYFDLQSTQNFLELLKTSESDYPLEVECLKDLSDFTTIDYFLVNKTDEYNQYQLRDFCSFYGVIIEFVENPSVYIVKFSDVRSVGKIEKIISRFKENEKSLLRYLRGIFYSIPEKCLRSMLTSTMIFNRENCSEIFFNKISNEKLGRENLLQDLKKTDERDNSKFKKRSLRITAESFRGVPEEFAVRAPLADLTNEIPHTSVNESQGCQKALVFVNRDSIFRETKEVSFTVDLRSIINKEDLRTTIMLRNIPNRFNQEALLKILDQNFKGLYDFFYLPMDFKNKCNIGYAFINFIDPKCIVDFYTEFNGRRWDILRSEKICGVCYARIQGRNALIKHFKRSNIINLELEKNFKPLILPNSLLDFNIF